MAEPVIYPAIAGSIYFLDGDAIYWLDLIKKYFLR
jgi:hypothetical protein